MALTNTRALNILCTIGGLNIDHKCITSFEVNRTIQDVADKFSMTLVDTPDTSITYDLEMYMAGGYRNITIKYGDLEKNTFTNMSGTIYDYSYNFVGNIKTLTISGICSAYTNIGIVGQYKYNIDWNSYVNKRKDETKPWNLQEITAVTESINNQFRYASVGNTSYNPSDFANSYILNDDYRKAILSNSETITIKSLKTSNSIQLPIPDLFISCAAPISDILSIGFDPSKNGRINDTSYINNPEYQDVNSPYYDYWRFCNASANSGNSFWGWLTPYSLKIISNKTQFSLSSDNFENAIVTVKDMPFSIIETPTMYHGIIPRNTVVGYKTIPSMINYQLYDDFGNKVYSDLDNSLYLKTNSRTGVLLIILQSQYNPSSSSAVNEPEYYNFLISNKKLLGEDVKITKIDGMTYLINSDYHIVSTAIGPWNYGNYPVKPNKEIFQNENTFIRLNSFKDSTLIKRVNNYLTNLDYSSGKKDTQYLYVIKKSFKSVSYQTVNPSVQDCIVWREDGPSKDPYNGPIRAFYKNDTMYIQAKPGTPSYNQASFLYSGVGVDPSDIVKKLAVLEGWITDSNKKDQVKFIAQTATLDSSENFIMNNESAIDFISKKLIPSSVLVSGVYNVKTKSGDMVPKEIAKAYAGYNLWFDDNNKIHYHPITKDLYNTLNINLGYNYPNSPVLAFSVNTKGTAFYTPEASKQLSTLSILTGEEITSISGLTNAEVYSIAKNPNHNAFLDAWYGSSYQVVEATNPTTAQAVSYYYNNLVKNKFVTSLVKSGATSSKDIQANMNKALDHIKEFTITASLSLIGNSQIRPGKFIFITNMVKGAGFTGISKNTTSFSTTGPKYNSKDPVIHPSSGYYWVIGQTDKFDSGAGFIQELNLIRQTEDVNNLLTQDMLSRVDFGTPAVWWRDLTFINDYYRGRLNSNPDDVYY